MCQTAAMMLDRGTCSGCGSTFTIGLQPKILLRVTSFRPSSHPSFILLLHQSFNPYYCWQYLHADCQVKETKGREYRGTVSTSAEGLACITWIGSSYDTDYNIELY